MFESAELSHTIDKETYTQQEPELRQALLDAQLELLERPTFSVILLISGADGAGKGAAIQRLYEWLDPRHLQTKAYGAPTDEERLRPRMWRYWRDLPPKGAIGVVFGSWYNDPLRAHVLGEIDDLTVERELEAIRRFEQMLASEGALILKLWLHISRAEQKKRLKKIEKSPGASRHVLEEWTGLSHHKTARRSGEMMARITSTAHAPWVVVPSSDDRYRDLTMGRILVETMRKRLDTDNMPQTMVAPAVISTLDRRTALDGLDLSQTVLKKTYRKELAAFQDRLAALTDSKRFRDIALVVAFEGNDAAGKGGSLRRLAAALDPRRFNIHSIASPSDEEKAQAYLWRFWRHVPRKGEVEIFDRTWYGRVLVERIEGFCDEAEWLRAYNEINDFEAQLDDNGIVVVKFWLAISKDEQLARFKAREQIPFKQYKITDEDWRNREKWDQYVQAIGDMVDRTSTARAPWTLVEAEDKRFARLKVLETTCERIEAAL